MRWVKLMQYVVSCVQRWSNKYAQWVDTVSVEPSEVSWDGLNQTNDVKVHQNNCLSNFVNNQ